MKVTLNGSVAKLEETKFWKSCREEDADKPSGSDVPPCEE